MCCNLPSKNQVTIDCTLTVDFLIRTRVKGEPEKMEIIQSGAPLLRRYAREVFKKVNLF